MQPLIACDFRPRSARLTIGPCPWFVRSVAPQASSEAETARLWGATHKRLWDAGKNREDLDEAVRAYILIKANRDGNAINWMGDSLNDQLRKLTALLTP